VKLTGISLAMLLNQIDYCTYRIRCLSLRTDLL
jgi:hypothetical protein